LEFVSQLASDLQRFFRMIPVSRTCGADVGSANP